METMQRKALVVDDDTCMRLYVSELLHVDGWETVLGRDAEEAVALAVTEMPDLVFLDVLMPGKDGIETYQDLRQDLRTAHIPVVMLTGANDYGLGETISAESIAQRCGLEAPQGFIEKPVDGQTIVEAAHRAVGE